MGVWLTGNISESNINIADNTSNVTVDIYINWNYGSWNADYPPPAGTIIIDGTSYNFAHVFNAGRTSSGSEWIGSATKIVAHSTDGSKAVSCSASFISGVSSGTIYWSSSKTLTTIPRASEPSLVSTSVDLGSTITITIDRKVSTFKHYVYANWAGRTVAIGNNIETSVSWSIPISYCDDIPNAVSAVGTIYVDTYNGSTLIGTKSINFTGNVPSSVIPTITEVSISEATAGLAAKFQAYVQNKSALNINITATGEYSSTITKYETYIQAVPYRTASFTSNILTASGTLGVVTVVTDSRGRTVQASNSVTVIEYSPPIINSMSAWRIDTSGIADDEGERIAMAMNFAISPVANKNDRTYAFKYKASSDTTFTTFGSGTANWTYDDTQYFISTPIISVDNAYVIRLEVTDYFQTVAYEFNVPTAFTIIDFRNTGKGIAFGKVSQKDSLEVALDSDFTGDVKIYSDSNNTADSGFLRLYRQDETLSAFLATSDNGNGLNLHLYSGGAWAGMLKIGANGNLYLSGNLQFPGGAMTDYIVEKGSNANGSYVKYNSGRLEMWGSISGSAYFSAANYIYYHSIGTVTFPIASLTVPNIVVSVDMPALAAASINSRTKTSFSGIIMSGNSGTASQYSYRYDYHAIGTWQ